MYYKRERSVNKREREERGRSERERESGVGGREKAREKGEKRERERERGLWDIQLLTYYTAQHSSTSTTKNRHSVYLFSNLDICASSDGVDLRHYQRMKQ